MAKLSLKDVKIQLPADFATAFTEADLIEWLEWELGARFDIKQTNPLYEIELHDCKVTIGESKIDLTTN